MTEEELGINYFDSFLYKGGMLPSPTAQDSVNHHQQQLRQPHQQQQQHHHQQQQHGAARSRPLHASPPDTPQTPPISPHCPQGSFRFLAAANSPPAASAAHTKSAATEAPAEGYDNSSSVEHLLLYNNNNNNNNNEQLAFHQQQQVLHHNQQHNGDFLGSQPIAELDVFESSFDGGAAGQSGSFVPCGVDTLETVDFLAMLLEEEKGEHALPMMEEQLQFMHEAPLLPVGTAPPLQAHSSCPTPFQGLNMLPMMGSNLQDLQNAQPNSNNNNSHHHHNHHHHKGVIPSHELQSREEVTSRPREMERQMGSNKLARTFSAGVSGSVVKREVAHPPHTPAPVEGKSPRHRGWVGEAVLSEGLSSISRLATAKSLPANAGSGSRGASALVQSGGTPREELRHRMLRSPHSMEDFAAVRSTTAAMLEMTKDLEGVERAPQRTALSSLPPPPGSRAWVSQAVASAAEATAKAKQAATALGSAGLRRSLSMGSPPLDANGQRAAKKRRQNTSKYRGVTYHQRTSRWEAHIWDQGRQMYLGGFDTERKAATAYDIMALKCRGTAAVCNFGTEVYQREMEHVNKMTKEELMLSLRRNSKGFSRGSSKYRGVSHHPNGRWEARIGHTQGRRYRYLGLYDTEVEAALAYDRAAVIHRGSAAVTNFDISNYAEEAQLHQREQLKGNAAEENIGTPIAQKLKAEGQPGKAGGSSKPTTNAKSSKLASGLSNKGATPLTTLPAANPATKK